MSTSSQSLPAHDERPERSRNAKAQARHRAKRKAYIDQLEQTVTKLQTALGFSTEQVTALPPPYVKIRELEQEIARLQRENDEMRRLLDPDGRGHRNSLPTFHDPRGCDRDVKRRKVNEDVYMNANHTPPSANEILSRPPPLTIPPPPAPTHPSHHYTPVSSHGPNTNGSTATTHHHHGNGHSSSLYALHAPAFHHQLAATAGAAGAPATPSSSTTSSPPFSQPAQLAPTSHHHQHPSSHRQAMTTPSHNGLSSYATANNHYPVKVEDDNYGSANHHRPSHSNAHGAYSSSFPSFHHHSTDHHQHPQHHHNIDSWQDYP